MNDGTLRRVVWRRLCPWLILFRLPRIATRPQVLLLGFLATVLTPIGWQVAHRAFLDARPASGRELGEFLAGVEAWPGVDVGKGGYTTGAVIDAILNYGVQGVDSVLATWHVARQGFERVELAAYLVAGALWTLMIWSFFGGAIARISVARLGCDERIGLRAAVRFARTRWTALVLAPLMPLIALLFLALLPACLGWLISSGGAAAGLGGALWGAAVLCGMLMAVLAVGLVLGYPLMAPTIAAEKNGDAFEALHRPFAYCTQRPFHLFFYAAVASVIGGATWVLVDIFFSVALDLPRWAAEVAGAKPAEFRVSDIFGTASDAPLRFHHNAIGAWSLLLRCIAEGFHFSFFWSAASAVYLLLRRDVDETDLDEIDLDEGPVSPRPSIFPPEQATEEASERVRPETSDKASAGDSSPSESEPPALPEQDA